VTDALDANVPEPFIMEMTGHKTRSVFDRYADPTVDHLRKGMTKIAAYRGKTSAPASGQTAGSEAASGQIWTPEEPMAEDDRARSEETALENNRLP